MPSTECGLGVSNDLAGRLTSLILLIPAGTIGFTSLFSRSILTPNPSCLPSRWLRNQCLLAPPSALEAREDLQEDLVVESWFEASSCTPSTCGSLR
mmetsp:Transcript_19705/g.34973  ORF Transcript_19705/g.34973 Transcript_19705/m.34973 type:complete len:96 (-) Transcript_19705:654-941(-)